jgi:hypothetical protein
MEMTVETSVVEVNSKITVSLNLLEGEGGAEADFGKGCVFLRSTGDVFDQSPDQVKQACYDLGSITVNVKTVVAGQQELYFVGATAEDGPVPTLGGNVTLNWMPGPTASLEAQEVLVDGVSVAAIDAGDEACFGLTAKDAYGNVAAGETRTPVGAVFALTGSPSPQVYAEEPFVAGFGRVCFTSTTPGSVQARASLQLIDSNVVPATFRAAGVSRIRLERIIPTVGEYDDVKQVGSNNLLIGRIAADGSTSDDTFQARITAFDKFGNSLDRLAAVNLTLTGPADGVVVGGTATIVIPSGATTVAVGASRRGTLHGTLSHADDGDDAAILEGSFEVLYYVDGNFIFTDDENKYDDVAVGDALKIYTSVVDQEGRSITTSTTATMTLTSPDNKAAFISGSGQQQEFAIGTALRMETTASGPVTVGIVDTADTGYSTVAPLLLTVAPGDARAVVPVVTEVYTVGAEIVVEIVAA